MEYSKTGIAAGIKNLFARFVSTGTPSSAPSSFAPFRYRPVAAMVLWRDGLNGVEFLIVKKPRKENAWQFPQGGVDGDESVVEAAIRELGEECGTELEFEAEESIVATYTYDFPKGFSRDGSTGASVRFIRAEWIDGECQPDGKEIVDFAWVTPESLPEYVTVAYLRAVYPAVSFQ